MVAHKDEDFTEAGGAPAKDPPKSAASTSSTSTSSSAQLVHNGVWKKMLPCKGMMPMPRHGHRAVLVHNLMVVFGGGNGEFLFNSVHVFNIDTNEWSCPVVKGSVPLPYRSLCGVVTEGTRLLLFGGMCDHAEVTDSLFSLETRTWEWSVIEANGTAPCARLGHSFTLLGNKVYLFGGATFERRESSNEPDVYARFLNDLYILELTTKDGKLPRRHRWQACTTHGLLPTPRESHTCVAYTELRTGSSKLIVYGGMNGTRLGDVWILDIASMIWFPPAIDGPEPLPRSLHTACLVGDHHMFIFGGWVPEPAATPPRSPWACTDSVACLNLEKMTWESVEPDPHSTPPPRAGHCAIAYHSRLLVWSGRNQIPSAKQGGLQACFDDFWYLELDYSPRPYALRPAYPPSGVPYSARLNSVLEVTWAPPRPCTDAYILQIQRCDGTLCSTTSFPLGVVQREFVKIKQLVSPDVRSSEEQEEKITLVIQSTPTATMEEEEEQASTVDKKRTSLLEYPNVLASHSSTVLIVVNNPLTEPPLAPLLPPAVLQRFTQNQDTTPPHGGDIAYTHQSPTSPSAVPSNPQKNGGTIQLPQRTRNLVKFVAAHESASVVRLVHSTPQVFNQLSISSSNVVLGYPPPAPVTGVQVFSFKGHQFQPLPQVSPPSRPNVINIATPRQVPRILRSNSVDSGDLKAKILAVKTAAQAGGSRGMVPPIQQPKQQVLIKCSGSPAQAGTPSNTKYSIWVKNPVQQLNLQGIVTHILSETTTAGSSASLPSTPEGPGANREQQVVFTPDTTVLYSPLSSVQPSDAPLGKDKEEGVKGGEGSGTLDTTKPEEESMMTGIETPFISAEQEEAKSAVADKPTEVEGGASGGPFSTESRPLRFPSAWHTVCVTSATSHAITQYYELPEDEHRIFETSTGGEMDAVAALLNLQTTALEPNTVYRLRVAGINAIGRGPWSETACFKTCQVGLPGAPSGVTIHTTELGARLAWRSPEHQAADIQEFNVFMVVRDEVTSTQAEGLGLGVRVTSGPPRLTLLLLHRGPAPECVVTQAQLNLARMDQVGAEHFIFFRLNACNDKGDGPMLQVKWKLHRNDPFVVCASAYHGGGKKTKKSSAGQPNIKPKCSKKKN